MCTNTRLAIGRVIASHLARAIRVTSQLREQMELLRTENKKKVKSNSESAWGLDAKNSWNSACTKTVEFSHISTAVSAFTLFLMDLNRTEDGLERTTKASASTSTLMDEGMSSRNFDPFTVAGTFSLGWTILGSQELEKNTRTFGSISGKVGFGTSRLVIVSGDDANPQIDDGIAKAILMIAINHAPIG